MRMKRRVLSVLLCLLLLMPATAFAQTFAEGYFYYEVAEGSVIITGYFGRESVVTVPATLRGCLFHHRGRCVQPERERRQGQPAGYDHEDRERRVRTVADRCVQQQHRPARYAGAAAHAAAFGWAERDDACARDARCYGRRVAFSHRSAHAYAEQSARCGGNAEPVRCRSARTGGCAPYRRQFAACADERWNARGRL